VLHDLHAARAGRPQALDAFLGAVERAESVPPGFLSQGLHESTLCLELAAPWDPAKPGAQRAAALAALAAARAPADFYPFDRATATGNGLARGCLAWPPTRPSPVADGAPAAELPPVPVLLLSGERDLSTPLAWARAEAALAPRRELLVVPGAGHSVQLRARDPAVRRVLARFLSTT
jgi:pimeloyl-ACP methyl ester carboxylesterase